MALADLAAAVAGLQVEQARAQGIPDFAGAMHALVEPRREQVEQESVQRFRIPPLVHVAFAQAQRALPQHPRIEMRIVDLQVPGPLAAYAYVRLRKQIADPFLEALLRHGLRPVAVRTCANSPEYSGARCGNRTAAGTSTVWVPSAYGPTW